MATETRTIAGVSKTVSYDYNLDGSLKALHYPSGAVVTYTPDSAGRTVSAVDTTNTASPINYVTSATYGPHNALTGCVRDHGHDHGQGDPHAHDIGRPADGSPPNCYRSWPGKTRGTNRSTAAAATTAAATATTAATA